MAAFPAASYLSNANRTEGEAKVAFEDWLASTKQMPGAGVTETELTISGGSITPPSGGPGIFKVDTEADASADDLTNIAQTNIPDGSLLIIRCSNDARIVTVKHAAGGSGQFTLANSQDVVLNSTMKWLMVKRTGSLWEAVFGPVMVSPVLAAGSVVAEPTTNLGIANKQYVDLHGFTTGDVKLSLKTVADTSWVLMDDKSIGSASSGATGRANADTEALYSLIWANITNTWAPVAGGRGANAAADFAANKAIFLPKTLGRALAGYGTGTVVASGVDADVDITANDFTVPSNNAKWVTGMQVVFTLTSGTITGLTTSTTYWIVRSSATKVKLASSLVNAQNGTTIDFTAKSSPVWTLTHTYTARVLGEAVGEESHAMSITELLAHTHGTNLMRENGASGFALAGGTGGNSSNSGSTGGNEAMNTIQPTAYLNVMVKL
jgi:hypothetical protein